jgi:hippurate hydrolase
MGGEDFSQFGRVGIPTFYFWLGSVTPEAYAASQRDGGVPLPPTHSDGYFPIPEPTIRTGVLSMSTLLLDLVGK